MYQAQCNTLATAAGINNAAGNAYIAWMAASNYAPVTLLGSSRGWVRADLLPWIDAMATALSTGNVYYPVAYDEDGRRVIGTTLAGMTQTGTYSSGYNCNDWTDATLNSSHGNTHAAGTGWAYDNVGISSCATADRVLCLSKGATAALTPTPAAGKKIFLTRTGWIPSGGVAGADAKCNADKPAAVISSKAILLASTRAFSDVLVAATTYVRPDGVKVGTGADIIQAMGTFQGPATLESPITQDGGGTYVNTGTAQVVWVGRRDSKQLRELDLFGGVDSGTVGAVAAGWQYTGNDGDFACNTPRARRSRSSSAPSSNDGLAGASLVPWKGEFLQMSLVLFAPGCVAPRLNTSGIRPRRALPGTKMPQRHLQAFTFPGD